jgi:hypothetical protein
MKAATQERNLEDHYFVQNLKDTRRGASMSYKQRRKKKEPKKNSYFDLQGRQLIHHSNFSRNRTIDVVVVDLAFSIITNELD